MDNDIPNIFLALNSADALEAPEPRWRKVNQAYPDTSRSDRHKSSTKQFQFRQGASAHSKQRLRGTGRVGTHPALSTQRLRVTGRAVESRAHRGRKRLAHRARDGQVSRPYETVLVESTKYVR